MYVLGTELRVVCFQRLVKKSDIAALVTQGLCGLQVLVTVPGISRPAAVFAAEQSVHVLTEDMYALTDSTHAWPWDYIGFCPRLSDSLLDNITSYS